MKRTNTRYQDLEVLDGMRKVGNTNKVTTARVNDVWKQAQDDQLEKARNLLIKAHRSNNVELANKIEEDIRKYSEKMGYGRW